jgi:malic enzyme
VLTVTNVSVKVAVMGAGSVLNCSATHESPLQKKSVVTIGAGAITIESVSVMVFVTSSVGSGLTVMTVVVH